MKLLLYCTKAKPKLYNTDKGFVLTDFKLGEYFNNKVLLNGKIVAECDFEVEMFDFASQRFFENDIEKYNIEIKKQNELLKRSCLSATQMVCYLDKEGKGQTNLKGYAIHIKNLNIFDKPRELNWYYNSQLNISKAPQNMCFVYEQVDENEIDRRILISIRPKWLCKILNGEKTIEVRRKVLKDIK